jgi:hypothetical protein
MSATNHTDLASDGIAAIAAHVTGPDGELDAAIGNRASLNTTNKTSLVAAINEVLATSAEGAGVRPGILIDWTAGESYEMTAITYHATYHATIATATVRWPDGSGGVFTTTAIDATWEAINAYTITHAASGKVVTQAAVSRNANGDVTVKPPLVVS